jgi:murein DD-endopeptidase MepM/ murein hydrolase activator NlpD
MLCLGVILWQSGHISGIRIPGTEASVPAWKQPMVPLPLNLNEMAEAKIPVQPADAPPPPLEPPPAVPQAPLLFGPPAVEAKSPTVAPPAVVAAPPAPPPPSKSGEADRMANIPPVAGPHLSMPLAGIDPFKLHDTFEDARDGRKHEALDIEAPRGTPVLAVAEGNVARMFTSKQGGLTVYQFDNTGTYCYYYAHLDRYSPALKEGMLLRKGDVLGYVGTTGNAPANHPHLHFAVFQLKPDKKWWQGTPLDPLPMFR